MHLHAKIMVYGFLILICIASSLGLTAVWSYLQPKGLPSCDSFGSYSDIKSYIKAHPNAIKRLDRNHNDIPCDEQYRLSLG